MFIKFEDPNSKFYEMVEEWNEQEAAGLEPFTKSHYELAEMSRFSASDWKDFLTNPQVADVMQQELLLLQQTKMRQLIQSVNSNTKSTGTAQLINTFSSNLEKSGGDKDRGPKFIYTMVPLNDEQIHAPNVRILDHNPFLKDDE